MWLRNVIVVLSVLVAPQQVMGELYASSTDLEALLANEGIFVETVEYLIKDQRRFLNELERKISAIKEENEQLTMESISNPIKQFKLIRRLSTSWKDIETELATKLESFKDSRQLLEDNQVMPSNKDVLGASHGIFRLQETYQLTAGDLASGIVDGVHTSLTLSAEDCLELGSHAFTAKEFNLSIDWLLEAHRMLSSSMEGSNNLLLVSLLDKLHVALYKVERVSEALNYVNQLLALKPSCGKGDAYRERYESILKIRSIPAPDKVLNIPFAWNEHERTRYLRVCRGEQKKLADEERHLRCRYTHNDQGYLRLGPIKEEDVNLDPRVVLFHEVVSDSEAEQMIEAAKDKLSSSATGTGDVSSVRVSKDSNIDSLQHPFLKNIEKRFEALTGLSASSIESHHLVSYGIGGHYEPHVDFSHQKYRGTPLLNFDVQGNRIATAVIYLSNVTKGGATAFPYLDTKVDPRKGSALFWFNLFKDGAGNYMTRHAACPVILGSKWCDNLWFRERGQEFHRKCVLEPDHRPEYDWISLLKE